jgi:hypothetical protein
MSYNGSGTFNINTTGQPVVAGTVISATAFNALTADLGVGLSTAITKDGQTTTTARITFAQGVTSSLTTDSTSTSTGSIITAGGVGIAKALFVGTTANFAGVTTFSAGTAALPAITTTGDTNTGIFFPAADTIAFTEGGTESMRIDSSGNVGIGTSSPGSRLQITSSAASTNAITMTGSTTSPVYTLYQNTGGNFYVGRDNSAGSLFGSSYASVLYSTGAYPMIFWTNDVERMRIDSSGNVGIGTTTPDALLQVYKASGKVATFGNNVNNNGNYIVLGGALSNKNWVLANNMIVGGEFGIGRTSANGGTTIGSAYDLMIDTNGGVKVANTLGVGYTTPSTSGAGITFPATQSASSDANTLDDYEEGTWTPTLYGSTTAGSTTYDVQSGTYTKVGRLVTCQIYLDISNKTGTGSVTIGGLPFTSIGGNNIGSGSIWVFNYTLTNQQILLIVDPSVTYAQFGIRDITTGTASRANMTNISTDFQCYGSFSYYV